MSQIKFVQTWDMVAGRKQEYAAFIGREFLPAMKASGLEVDSGWYTLLGGGPHVVMESLAESLNDVERALHNERARGMLERFMNLVDSYSSCVLEPAEWKMGGRGEGASKGAARLLQTWDVLAGEQEALDRFVREAYISDLEAVGLTVTSAWRLTLGAGPKFLLEATESDLSGILKVLGDERFLKVIMKMEKMVSRHENRVLVRHERLLDVVDETVGRAIRSVSLDELHSMVGPIGE
jgi:hypothetical protein